VFTSDRDSDPEIYVMHADGSMRRRLTFSPGRDAHPSFSRDGSKILFQSPRANGHDTNIYIMGSDGSTVLQLTRLKGFAGVPVYGPDGKTIVFQWRETSDFNDARKWRLCLMDADGGNVRPLTLGEANDQVPSFSPDGKHLLFFSDRTGKDQLYTMRPDGGDVRRVASTASNDSDGSWSPDGTKIAFTSDRNGSVDIYVMDADGGHVHRLTDLHATARGPVWSPDGKRILFSVDGLGASAIFVVGANGAGPVRLTEPAASRELGLVPLTGEASVALLDLDSARMLDRIPVGPHPQDVVMSHDSVAFALEMGNETQPGHVVVVLSLNRRRVVRSIDIAPYTRPHWGQLSSDGGTLWVACEPESAIVEVDVRGSRVGRVWHTSHSGGWMFAVSGDGSKIYVAQFDAAGLTVLDRTTGTQRWVALSGRPIGIQLTPDGREVWIGTTGTDSVYVVSTATDTVVARFASLGREPARIVFTPHGDRAVISDSRSDSVTIYDVATRRALRALHTGQHTWPKGLALSRDGSIAYVSLMETGDVIAVGVESGAILGRVHVGASPERVAPWESATPRSSARAAQSFQH
jgi:YVTN family beta-propeller protein